jgi:hypothetical protein
MPARNVVAVDSVLAERSPRRHGMLLALVATVGVALILGTVAVLWTKSAQRRDEAMRTEATLRSLRIIGGLIRGHWDVAIPFNHDDADFDLAVPLPQANDASDDGLAILAAGLGRRLHGEGLLSEGKLFLSYGESSIGLPLPRDGWGRPLRYRCPGPIHPRGWDLYSVGPNGIDEHGLGDDILVGADTAPIASER